MDKIVKKLFPVAPIVSFISARKLSSYLVGAKLYPLQRTVGSFKCNKPPCESCINVIQTDTFTIQELEKALKSIIYLTVMTNTWYIFSHVINVESSMWGKQTVNSFRFRYSNYNYNYHKHAKSESVKQQHLYDHFMLEGVSVIFIDKTDPTDLLTLSWRSPLSYRNQSTDLRNKSMDWFLYHNGLRHKRVKGRTVLKAYLKSIGTISPKRFWNCIIAQYW